MPTSDQTYVIKSCLQNFRDSPGVESRSLLPVRSALPVLLDSLLERSGVGIQMSGVYLSDDEDWEMIPDYLDQPDSMAFEYMGEHVVVSMAEGITQIRLWCERNVSRNRQEVLDQCDRLIALFISGGE